MAGPAASPPSLQQFCWLLARVGRIPGQPAGWSTLRLACPLQGLMPRINLSARLHIGPISIHTHSPDQIHPLRGPQEYTRPCAWKSEEPSFYRSEIFGPRAPWIADLVAQFTGTTTISPAPSWVFCLFMIMPVPGIYDNTALNLW